MWNGANKQSNANFLNAENKKKTDQRTNSQVFVTRSANKKKVDQGKRLCHRQQVVCTVKIVGILRKL